MALAEAGGTVHQIMAWTGHKSVSEIEVYTRKADRIRAVMGAEIISETPLHNRK